MCCTMRRKTRNATGSTGMLASSSFSHAGCRRSKRSIDLVTMRLLSSLLLLAAIASAQKPTPKPDKDPDVVISVDTRLVVLPVTVADKSGKLIPNLPQSAFKVFENGAEQPIKIFR